VRAKPSPNSEDGRGDLVAEAWSGWWRVYFSHRACSEAFESNIYVYVGN
jgi:hypothetical protein